MTWMKSVSLKIGGFSKKEGTKILQKRSMKFMFAWRKKERGREEEKEEGEGEGEGSS